LRTGQTAPSPRSRECRGARHAKEKVIAMIGQIFKSLFHAFFKVVLTLVICAVVGSGVTLLVAYIALRQWPPSHLTLIATVAIAVLSAYSGALTVLLGEVIRGLVAALRLTEREALSTGNLVENSIKAAERAAKLK
jgi:hypothetical protein